MAEESIPIQFEMGCQTDGLQAGRRVLEVLLHLRNLGTFALVAANARVDVLYLDSTDEEGLFADAG